MHFCQSNIYYRQIPKHLEKLYADPIVKAFHGNYCIQNTIAKRYFKWTDELLPGLAAMFLKAQKSQQKH